MTTHRSVSSYLYRVWQARLFWSSLAALDLRKRYRRSTLGVGWALLMPVATASVICAVFTSALGMGFGQHFPFVLVGLCVWNFMAATLREGAACIYWSETYLRQHPAPLAIYPLRIVLSAAMHLGVALAPLVAWSALTHGAVAAPALVLLLMSLALLVILFWGLATIAGILNVYLSDTAQVLEVGLQLGFYATPIIYAPELLRSRNYGWIVDVNPAAAAIEAVRAPLLTGGVAPWPAIGLLCATTVVTWAVAGLLLSRFERTIIFRL
ncbi:MAG: ABC transporter permease [Planctomycetaceae bacterium]